MKHQNVLKLQYHNRSKQSFGNLNKLPFTPKFAIRRNELEIKEILNVSSWADMEYRKYPKRNTLVSNLVHDREAVMLYSPTGVGKTWLSLAIAMIVAGRGKMELLDWENQDPQPVCYVDGEMLEEDIHERIKLLIPSLDVDEDLLRKNFRYLSRVSQPDDVEDFLSFELEKNQVEILSWLNINTESGVSPLLVLDNLSNLVELGDDNSAGKMQSFNMMVTKARKAGCSMGIVHHTIKTWRSDLMVFQHGEVVMIWQQDLIKLYVCYLAIHHLMDM